MCFHFFKALMSYYVIEAMMHWFQRTSIRIIADCEALSCQVAGKSKLAKVHEFTNVSAIFLYIDGGFNFN
jgi:hypothetical protein